MCGLTGIGPKYRGARHRQAGRQASSTQATGQHPGKSRTGNRKNTGTDQILIQMAETQRHEAHSNELAEEQWVWAGLGIYTSGR